MAPITTPVKARRATSPVGVALRAAIVTLTLGTAVIHASLGSLLFLANAAGYTVLAVAMVLPLAVVAERRWVVRVALIGFTAATIGGWLMFGARFPLAYLDKGIEIALIGLLVAEVFRYDGGPTGLALRVIDLAIGVIRVPFARRGAA